MAGAAILKRILGATVLLAIAVAAVVFGLRAIDVARMEAPIAGLEEPRTVVVTPGSSLTAVARQLAAAGLLEHPGSWIRYARRAGLSTRLQAGEYVIEPGSSPAGVLSHMVEGDVLLHTLTLPEGWTVMQALAAIQRHEAVEVRLPEPTLETVAEAIGLAGASPEGRIFPDTYRFARGTTDIDLLRRGREKLERELTDAWASRAADVPLKTPDEALILASIIEKETGIAEERPIIAGVFANRLRRGMRLQTDPTVIYGMGEAFDGNLRRADLTRDTPWNTYTRAGLPPTPIAIVGREALLAAVQPAQTGALFFVATGRGDGRHYFARTLDEHNDNVARYIAAVRGAARDGGS